LKAGSPEVLLLQRQTVESDPWSGQISFPGGRSKAGETSFQTAKREAIEEAGVDLDRCEIVGKMDDVFPGNLSIRVTPFVIIAPEATVVEIDHREIVDYFWISLDFFSSEKNSTVYTFSRLGKTIQTPSFVILGKHVVWGMTLRIILNLLSELGQFSREAP
jgi:8-oxo-dGTP pyrophosphatase MutT (NUDIX family)